MASPLKHDVLRKALGVAAIIQKSSADRLETTTVFNGNEHAEYRRARIAVQRAMADYLESRLALSDEELVVLMGEWIADLPDNDPSVVIVADATLATPSEADVH